MSNPLEHSPQRAEELALSLNAYDGPVDAFNTVASAVLTEAAAQGLVDFSASDLRMLDAADALNIVAQHVGDNSDHPWYKVLGFLVDAYNTDQFKHTFSFGIEAVQDEDGKVRIWWPQ